MLSQITGRRHGRDKLLSSWRLDWLNVLSILWETLACKYALMIVYISQMFSFCLHLQLLISDWFWSLNFVMRYLQGISHRQNFHSAWCFSRQKELTKLGILHEEEAVTLAVLRASAAFWSLISFGTLNVGKGRKSKLSLIIIVSNS